MEFKEGTTVKTADGDKVGRIDRLVVDPRSNTITHIVVEKGFIFKTDRVIPIDQLAEADDDTVMLNHSVDDLDQFPEFEETYYVSPDHDYRPAPWGEDGALPLFYYPPAGMGRSSHSYVPPVSEQHVESTSRNVPVQTVAISENTGIRTSDGEYAGDVKKVFANEAGEITHLLISKGFIFTEERLVPVHWVEQMGDEELYLSVPTKIVEDLPEHHA